MYTVLQMPTILSQPKVFHQQIRSLLAYRYGPHKGLVSVVTEHVTIDNGISIPVLNSWVPEHADLSSAFIVSTDTGPDFCPTTFYIICSQSNPLRPTQDSLTSELLVFRKGTHSDHLVNLRTSDMKLMKDVTKWYIFAS